MREALRVALPTFIWYWLALPFPLSSAARWPHFSPPAAGMQAANPSGSLCRDGGGGTFFFSAVARTRATKHEAARGT
jgi:hypothetical protein